MLQTLYLSSDASNIQNLAREFSRIGGRKPEYVIRKILERVFTSQLALQYNYTGKNNKNSIRGTRLLDVIIDATRLNNFTQDAAKSVILVVVKSWLRFAKNRNGGRGQRRRANTE